MMGDGKVLILIPEKHDYGSDADINHKSIKFKTFEALVQDLGIKRMALEGFQKPSEDKISAKGSINSLMGDRTFSVCALLAKRFAGTNLEFSPTERYEDIVEQMVYSDILKRLYNDTFLETDPKDVEASRNESKETLVFALRPDEEGYQKRCKKYNIFMKDTINALGLNSAVSYQEINKACGFKLNPAPLYPVLNKEKTGLKVTGGLGAWIFSGKDGAMNAFEYVVNKSEALLHQRNTTMANRIFETEDKTVIMNVGAHHAPGLVIKDLEKELNIPVIVLKAGSHDEEINDTVNKLQSPELIIKNVQSVLDEESNRRRSFPNLPNKNTLI